MMDATETRELFTLEIGRTIVRGTYHKPCDKAGTAQASAVAQERLGFCFLNSMSPTRAGTGDSAVYWADALAKQGYRCVRFDVPGFGDSDGDPPEGLVNFINAGGYSSSAGTIIDEVVRRFNFSGTVIAGLCAGAVSAIYTAEVSKNCKGLVLLDPYFHLRMEHKRNLRHRVREKLCWRMSRSTPGRAILSAYDQAKALWKRMFTDGLPSIANIPLIRCWQRLTTSGMPVLVLNASGTKLRKVEFDYLAHVLKLAGRNSRVEVKVVEGTGHTFSNRTGRSEVQNQIESWLNTSLSSEACGKSVKKTLRSELAETARRGQELEGLQTVNLKMENCKL
jgi:pimeloyl-ACP methyl ester carboxylesterase